VQTFERFGYGGVSHVTFGVDVEAVTAESVAHRA
jgi:hypothetical protein